MTDLARKQVLKQIFSTKPARVRRDYISSRSFEQRYVLLTGGKLERQPTFSSRRLPRWLMRANQLGDYEKRFFFDLLGAPGSLIAYRSGTGSGKSSMVSAIHWASKEISEKSSWSNHFPVDNFVALIDLQSAENADIGISANLYGDNISDERFDRHNDKLFSEIGEKLQNCLFEICADPNFKELMLEIESHRKFSRRAPYRSLLRILRPHFGSDPTILTNAFSDYTAGLPKKEVVDLLLHIFVFIGFLHGISEYPKQGQKSFVLFIDNSDKLHHVLLTRLINYLKEFSQKTEDIDRNLKIACPSSYKMGHQSGLSIGGSGSFA